MTQQREFISFVGPLLCIGISLIGLCSLPAAADNPPDGSTFRGELNHAARLAEGSLDEMREWLRDRDLERRLDSPRPDSADDGYSPETGTIIEEGYRPYRPVYRGHRKSHRSHYSKRYRARLGKAHRHSVHASRYSRAKSYRSRGTAAKVRRGQGSLPGARRSSPHRSAKVAPVKAKSSHRVASTQQISARRTLRRRR